MALKPSPQEKVKEEEIKKILNMGGKVAIEQPKEEWTMISVRMPKWILKDIDTETGKRAGLSRNAWILEALQEKIKKSENA